MLSYKVEILECERGWGQRLDEVKFFPSEQAALDFCTQYNACNTLDHAPDWYMVAIYCGRVS